MIVLTIIINYSKNYTLSLLSFICKSGSCQKCAFGVIVIFLIFHNYVHCRNGEEWYRIRRILNVKMLRPKVTEGYAEPLNDVAADLLSQMKATRDADGIIPSLQDELFKWSLECKLA